MKKRRSEIVNIGLITIGSIIIAAGFNLLLIPNSILSSGLSGIAMMLGMITPIDTGVLNFILNLPFLLVGLMLLGKRFIFYTIYSVVLISVALMIIPVYQVAHEPILAALFGGVVTGIGVGIIFRASGSSGGFDILAVIISERSNFPLGAMLSALNAVVVVASGFIFSWDAALNTLITIYATGKVIDMIHTNNIKLTMTIITTKGDALRDKLLANLYRGITITDGTGAYTGEQRKILMTVITRYQLADVKDMINEVDPQAFVNITETKEVIGMFAKT